VWSGTSDEPAGGPKWITRIGTRPNAGRRLFCFPHAGSGAAAYRKWASCIPDRLDINIINLPGRERRINERPFTDLKSAIRILANELANEFEQPFALFGHSVGALLAFELARHLARSGIIPIYLVVSGRASPRLSPGRQLVHELPNEQLIETVRNQYGGITESLVREPGLLDLVVPILRADLQLAETYEYIWAQPLSCPIAAIAGQSDHTIDTEGLAAWRNETTSSFTAARLAGGHFYLLADPRRVTTFIADLIDSLSPLGDLMTAERGTHTCSPLRNRGDPAQWKL
jgi:medium-chain acyl-[acyl-carrier-protein] hydrolase